MQGDTKRQKITNYSLFEDPRLHLNHIVEIAKNLDDKTLWNFCVSASRFRKICQEVPELKQRYLNYIQCSHRRAALRRIFDLLDDSVLSQEWRKFLFNPVAEHFHYGDDNNTTRVDATKTKSTLGEHRIEANIMVESELIDMKWTFVLDENQCPSYYKLKSRDPIDLSKWAKTGRIRTFHGRRPGVFTRFGDEEATGMKWTELADMIRELM